MKSGMPVFPVFFERERERYLSVGESESRYVGYKTPKKLRSNSISGKIGNDPPIGSG